MKPNETFKIFGTPLKSTVKVNKIESRRKLEKALPKFSSIQTDQKQELMVLRSKSVLKQESINRKVALIQYHILVRIII